MRILKAKPIQKAAPKKLPVDVIDGVGDQYATIKENQKREAEQLKKLRLTIDKLIAAAPRHGKTQSVRGNRWEVGVLYRGGNEINEQRLQKLLTPVQWKQITTTRVVVDQVLLEEAIKAGAITARTLAKCITPKKETPSLYIKELK